MGMTVDHCEIVHSENFVVREDDLNRFDDTADLAEVNPLDLVFVDGVSMPTHHFPWGGEGSRDTDVLFDLLRRCTSGRADIVIHWEGMGCDGVRVVDGVVTEHRVAMRLMGDGER